MMSMLEQRELFPNCLEMTLNRPDVGNALSLDLIRELTQAFETLSPTTRIVVLSGSGKYFCTGADLNDMKSAIHASKEQNESDARELAILLRCIASCPQPVIGIAHGATFGGGVGLLAACDFVLAQSETLFCFSEVMLGLIPAIISPYVISAFGKNRARKLFLTAERFSAGDAQKWGLVDHVYDEEAHYPLLKELTEKLLRGGPEALAEAKKLTDPTPSESDFECTIQLIANRRTTSEAQEGMTAFFEKRKPKWVI